MKKLLIIFTLLLSVVSCKQKNTNYPNDPTFSNTGFEVINSTKDSVLLYLTIGAPFDSTCVQSVDGIFGIPQGSGLQGSVWLQPNEKVTYTPTLFFSGNIGFGSTPQNCITSGLPMGMNIFEFTTNVDTASNESIDVSCVAGANCIMNVKLIGGPDWISGNAKSIRSIENKPLEYNTGIYGVFPYGCTSCINTDGIQPCQTLPTNPNKEKICLLTRSSNKKGGLIRLTFKGYIEPASKN